MEQQPSSVTDLKRQVFFWLAILAFFIAFLFLFSSILLPFIAGMAIAYFLDPVADWLERRGLSRTMATLVILVVFVLIFALALTILIPIIVNQFNDFLQHLPGYVEQFQQFITNTQNSIVPQWIRNQAGTIKDNISTIMSDGVSFVAGLFGQLWSSGKALVNIVSLMVVTPVVAFYMLLDWDRMIAKVDAWIPASMSVPSARSPARSTRQSPASSVARARCASFSASTTASACRWSA